MAATTTSTTTTHPPHISQPPSTNADGPKQVQSAPNNTNYPPTAGDGYGNGNGISATPTSGLESGPVTATGGAGGEFKASLPQGQPKRLHVSNIPFRFREPDLRQLFYVSTPFADLKYGDSFVQCLRPLLS